MTTAADLTSRVLPALRTQLARLAQLIGEFAGLLILLVLAMASGIVSSWYAINTGLPFNTETAGPWVTWSYAGDAASEPYTRARFKAAATLLIHAERVVRLEARVDDDGNRLHSSCTYHIDSAPLAAQWWTISVFDSNGKLIANAAQRYGFNKTTVARDPAGHFRVVLARNARPGNWLPTGSAGRMTVILEMLQADEMTGGGRPSAVAPPSIVKVSC